jgi:hypothetical protein
VTELERRLVDALKATNALYQDIATALEGHGDIALRDDLLKRVQENAELIREVQR